MGYLTDLLYLVPLLFIAGVIDGIAGGGGVIALPAYLLTGMPVHSAYACNKLQSGLGTITAGVKLVKDGFVDFKLIAFSLLPTVLASLLCTRLMLNINGDVVKIIIICLMPFVVLTMFLKRRVRSGSITRLPITAKNVLLGVLVGAIIGCYDAFFGPGGGTIAMILFSIFFGYDLRVGNGNGKIIIFASNLTATVNYIISGYMIWYVSIPCTLANMLGSYIGASIVVKRGEKVVFPAMITVLVFLVVQTVLNVFT